jgi:6-phosphogluconolactonase
MSVHRFTAPDPPAAAEACANHVVRVLEEALSGQQFATFAISGGSTPRLLFDRLAHLALPWDRVHLFWVDERCVPPTDNESNYRLAEEHLIKPAHIPAVNLHRIHGEMLPPEGAARYVSDIREFFGLEEGEFPPFDLVHRGMGPDGHSASLFPNDPLTEDRENIAGAAYSERFQQWRVTLLPGALLAARNTVFLVTGADKQEAVRATFQGPYDPQQYPAQIVAHHGRGVAWFLDEPAAKLLLTNTDAGGTAR